MSKYLTKEQVSRLVSKVRGDYDIILKFIEKYGKDVLYHISHGELHLDFDNQCNSPMNNDILCLFPMEMSVAITSHKGSLYGNCLDLNAICYSGYGTGEILTDMIMRFGDEKKIREMMLKYRVL